MVKIQRQINHLLAPRLPQLQLGIHTDNASHKVPIAIFTNPIRDQDTGRPVTVTLSTTMTATQVIDRSRIQSLSNLLRPRLELPEVARAQEIDVKRVRFGSLRAWQDTERVAGFTRAVALLVHIFDLGLDVLCLQDLVEILDADLAAGAEGVGTVVGPSTGVDTPAAVLVGMLQAFFDVEAAHENDLAADFTQGGDLGLRVPPALWGDVVVAQDATQLLICVFAGTFALEADDEGLGWVVVEELVDFVHQVTEEFVSCQRDGEDAVH